MIRESPKQERPRERCLNAGPEALSLRECLALLLGSGPPGKGCLGLAQEVLNGFGGLPEGRLEDRAFFTGMETNGVSLQHLAGLGEAGRCRILAAFEIARRYAAFKEEKQRGLLQVARWDQVMEQAITKIPQTLRNQNFEWLGFVPIFKSGGIGEFCLVEKGTRTHVNIELREFFGKLLALKPDAAILAHNHPSGDLQPSESDRHLTNEIRTLAQQLQIQILGHIIVSGSDEYVFE